LTGQKKEDGEPASVEHQIGNFRHAWRKAFGEEIERPGNWDAAFYELKKKVEAVTAAGSIVVVFFDELPWLCTPNSRFFENLDQAWNTSFEPAQRVKLIACGSASTWILKKIVYAKAGLSRRVTQRIRLAPFNLAETREYLRYKKFDLTDETVVETYMITGGVPYYLDFLKPDRSIHANIDEELFGRDGHLAYEYDIIFDSLFRHSGNYKKVVEILAQKHQGFTLNELQREFNPENSSVEGSLIMILDNLHECGFISKRVQLFNKRKGVVYALIDEFILFHLKWLKDKPSSPDAGFTFRQSVAASASYRIWQGFSFEMLCLKHEHAIRHALGIDRIAAESGFFHVYDKDSGARVAQIDLLFDRADKTISLCEIKHYASEYEITRNQFESMKTRRDELLKHLARKRKPARNVLFAYITMHGLNRNSYFNELQPTVVTLEDLFFDGETRAGVRSAD
jgi:hypothetical protein